MTQAKGHCRSVAPIMPTTDIARTEAHYQQLGFTVHRHSDDFLMTKRDDIELFFSLSVDHDPKRTAACIYVRVDDADALHAEWQDAGISGLREVHDTDYKMREFPHIDLDGNLILFGSPL